MKAIATLVSAAVLAMLLSLTPAIGQEAARPSAEQYCASAIRSAEGEAAKGAGEQFCWVSNYVMGDFVAAYRAWKDPAWLDAGVKFYDYCLGKMSAGPDGYKGWVGRYGESSQKIWADVHVGDSVLLAHMLDFAELVLKDDQLKAKYAEPAKRYVETARKDLFEKWDARGTWHEDGPFGGYVQWDTFCEAGDLKSWSKRPTVEGAGISLPFNKQNDMGLCALKLYRITGDKKFRDKAQRIFAFMKSRFQLVEDPAGFPYYAWNYWEPFYAGDVDVAKKDTRHWMNVHPIRNYQSGEIEQIAEAYQSGLVFSREDIVRIMNTNLKVMWNGDRANPRFVNSNARLPVPALSEEEKKKQEEALKANPIASEGRAGCLWGDLCAFSQIVRDLCAPHYKEAKGTRELIHKAVFETVTLKTPPGFKRALCDEKDATVLDFPFHDCKSLTVASVLPCVVKRGTAAVVFCKARIPVELEVALYSADGQEKLQTLYRGKVEGGTDGHAGVFFFQWDPGQNQDRPLKAGDYRVRWTVPDGYREFKITVAE